MAQVFHFDLYGKREDKYDFLNENSLASVQWIELQPEEPSFFFVNKNMQGKEEYEKGFKVDELFKLNNVGIVTARDAFTLYDTQKDVVRNIKEFIELEAEVSRTKFDLGQDARDWKVELAKKDLVKNYPNNGQLIKVDYRPFDTKWTFYTGNSKGFHSYPRYEIMKNLLSDNVALIVPKQANRGFKHIFISNKISDKNFIDTAGQFGAGNVFPLYLYPESNEQQSIEQTTERTPNLNMEIVNQIAEQLGLTFINEKNITTALSGTHDPEAERSRSFAPIDLLDYVYAILHSPSYREKYKEFLKIDFPRVPYPTNAGTFWQLVQLGGEIRQIHLFESPIVENYITQYPIDDNNVVAKPRFVSTSLNDRGKVFINDTQYFDNVPKVAWEFYIGGYQPAQKWLKDRKGRQLEFEDIVHYQKIIVALSETDRLMKEIDKTDILK